MSILGKLKTEDGITVTLWEGMETGHKVSILYKITIQLVVVPSLQETRLHDTVPSEVLVHSFILQGLNLQLDGAFVEVRQEWLRITY